MIFIKVGLRAIAIALFSLITGYIICFGKSHTSIKVDYMFTVLFIVLFLLLL
ncbi:hypothetical protein [Paraclostridium bifermentans]|uniref:hypothetical protein n=1 Tax=Paraclostridium bifermentans TaxID=1490 RepID=UPI00374FA607